MKEIRIICRTVTTMANQLYKLGYYSSIKKRPCQRFSLTGAVTQKLSKCSQESLLPDLCKLVSRVV